MPQSCMFFVTFRVWDQKTVHNTKKCSGLTLFGASLVAPILQPALPSPCLKLARLLVAAVRFCMGDHCVSDGAANLSQSPFIIMGPRTYSNWLYRGSQNGNHC